MSTDFSPGDRPEWSVDLDYAAAQHRLFRAALEALLASDYGDESRPHYDASAQHAEEQMALAARDLVRAVEALPANERPIGWDSSESAQ